MAYTKTNWIDGVTPMNDVNLNKIEAGIFNTESQLLAFPISGTDGTTSWVKFADGTMIQYFRTSGTTYAIDTVYGPLFYGTALWTFALSFYDVPTVTCSEFRWGSYASWAGVISSPTISQVTLRGYDVQARAAGTNTIIAAVAVGRWKA